jgi:DNA-binding transcriptional ArsR family regulator
VARPSSIDRLPEEVRLEIARLRQNGRTIDEILSHLRKLDGIAPVSRSALGRHLKSVESLGERIRRSRQVAEVLAKEFGDAPESRAARTNIELMHTAVLDFFTRAENGDEEIDKDGKAALSGNPMGMMMLAKALDHLTRASRANEDFVAKAEQRAADHAKRDAAKAVDSVGREKGISVETLNAIKAGIFGVKATA